MRYSLKKRIISLVLCLSMIAPIITQHAPVYAMTLSDYEDNIGCTATFNTTTGEETYFVTVSEPNDSWGKDSLVFFAYEIPADLMLEIVSVKIFTEKYEGFNESGGTQLIERQSLWYQVKLHSGTMPDDFSDGYWVMQNFLNKEDIYEYDSLIIYPKASVAVYDANGNKVDAIKMPQFEKPEFTANSTLGESADYQWQIQYQKNSWVDIQGETSKTVKLSYGMLAGLLNDAGVAYIRCKSTSNTKIAYSDVIPVTVEMYQPKDPDVVVSDSFTSSSGETVTVTVVGTLPEDASVQLDETDSSGVDVKPGETVTAALDISIKNADGSEWQPESGEVVTVSLEADKIGLKNGDKFVVYHLHNDEVKVLGSYVVVNNTVTFNVDGFSKFVFALTTQTVFSEDFEAIKKDARNFTAASNATYAVARAAENDTTIHNVVINYVYENGKTAETSFTSTIGVTGHLNTKVVFPTILGYLPYVDDVRMDEYTFDLKGSDMTQDFVMNVVYKPTLVDYTVVVMQQNVHNDSYTEFERKTLQALTGTVITGDMQVDISYPGFYQLLHNQVTIAADGSTVIEVRFDRYYYLMTFELGEGGYGVLPVYARCGTEVEVNNPTRPGYVFTHWSNPQGETVAFPMEMPTHDTVITANWTPSSAKYSVVYWKENADPNSDGTYGYTYWGSTIVDSISGTVVSGKDDIPTSITNATVNGQTVNEKNYFTYNDSLTDKNVVVKGDGSTVVNVYYTRNYYTIYFTGYGKCCLDEHTHGTGCNSKLICTLEEHTHGTTCNRVLSCTIPVHSAHSSDCLICGKTEHLAHTNDCLRCTHSHALSCFSVGNTRTLRKTDKPTDSSIPSNPVNGTVYSYTTGWFSETHYYLYLDGVWYCAYYRNGMSGNYTKSDTTRISNCSHSHTTECYKDELHTHISSCYKDVIHAHNESCYKYSCGKVNHTHGSDCYSDCTLVDHEHTNNCNTNRTNNVVYVITAKYEANVGNIWPTYDKLAASDSYHYKNANGAPVNNYGSRFRGWSIPGASNEAVSKRINMTPDLCNTTNGYQTATATYSASYSYKLYYMFESFDQTDTQETDTRKEYNGVWYDSDPVYYQELMYSSETTFKQKEILGMNPVGVEDDEKNSVIYNWLFYTRNRSSLKYQNIDTVIETKSDIMFGESLAGYQYTANAGIPPYPSSLEAGAYEFAGWYTTAGCYKGTEVNFDTATMPNGDMVLYAKWEPVTHTVQFYAQKDNSGNLLEKIGDTYEVKHNQKLNEQYIPKAPEDFDNGAYSFNGWWYMDGNTEQRFDFKSLPVTRDLVVYAKWTSNKLIQYEFHFQLADGTPVADSVYGSDLAGNTITYDAKGGTSLYSKYRTGYFPNTPSHSLTLNIDDEDGVLSYTFVYSAAGKVPYTVHYVTEKLKDGGTSLGTIEIGNKSYFILASTKTVADNQLAYVSENFVSVPGYVPDKFQKNLVIVPDRDNTIVFYYTADEKNAPYKVTHYIQNLDGQTWTVEYTYTGITEIGSLYSENPLTNLVGFTYAPDQSTSSGTVSANGLELNLYYVRNKYPYKVVYKVQSTGQVIYTSDTKTEMYGKIVSATAPLEYNGIYSRVSEATQTATIRVESDSKNPQYNVITFFYEEKEVTINYEVEGPAGCGTVSSESETFRISSNSASGSVAKPSSDVYKFVGWYTDKNCTNKVSDDATFVPQKPEGQWADEITYYAKFEYNLTSLTIKKQGHDAVDVNQTFIFTVKGIEGTNTEGIDLTVTIHGNGEITITDLPVGDYVIIEHTDWSWRYEAAEEVKRISVLPVEANSVVFNNTRAEIYWLDGDSWCNNIFNRIIKMFK